MRTLSQLTQRFGSKNRVPAASAVPAQALSDAELDQVAAAGGTRGGGVGTGGRHADWPPPPLK
jgi:hypothetical protein